MDISGKLIKILEPVTGTSANGTWKKQLFVIGEDVHVFFEPESREYNNNWYTDLRAWKVESVQNQAGSFSSMPTPPPPTGAPAPTEMPDFMGSDDNVDGDLPF